RWRRRGPARRGAGTGRRDLDRPHVARGGAVSVAVLWPGHAPLVVAGATRRQRLVDGGAAGLRQVRLGGPAVVGQGAELRVRVRLVPCRGQTAGSIAIDVPAVRGEARRTGAVSTGLAVGDRVVGHDRVLQCG